MEKAFTLEEETIHVIVLTNTNKLKKALNKFINYVVNVISTIFVVTLICKFFITIKLLANFIYIYIYMIKFFKDMV